MTALSRQEARSARAIAALPGRAARPRRATVALSGRPVSTALVVSRSRGAVTALLGQASSANSPRWLEAARSCQTGRGDLRRCSAAGVQANEHRRPSSGDLLRAPRRNPLRALGQPSPCLVGVARDPRDSGHPLPCTRDLSRQGRRPLSLRACPSNFLFPLLHAPALDPLKNLLCKSDLPAQPASGRHATPGHGPCIKWVFESGQFPRPPLPPRRPGERR